MNNLTPDDVVEFWYSDIGRQCWYQSTPELDKKIFSNYESVWQHAVDGKLLGWQDSAKGCLALVIILDQFPLNMFRGLEKSFSSGSQAIAVTRLAIERGFDQLISHERLNFLFVPLMHSENIEDQELSVQLFTQNNLTKNIRYAVHHRDLIKKFGRFPHRNAILGRTSSEQEIQYLNSKHAFKG